MRLRYAVREAISMGILTRDSNETIVLVQGMFLWFGNNFNGYFDPWFEWNNCFGARYVFVVRDRFQWVFWPVIRMKQLFWCKVCYLVREAISMGILTRYSNETIVLVQGMFYGPRINLDGHFGPWFEWNNCIGARYVLWSWNQFRWAFWPVIRMKQLYWCKVCFVVLDRINFDGHFDPWFEWNNCFGARYVLWFWERFWWAFWPVIRICWFVYTIF